MIEVLVKYGLLIIIGFFLFYIVLYKICLDIARSAIRKAPDGAITVKWYGNFFGYGFKREIYKETDKPKKLVIGIRKRPNDTSQ